MKLAVVKKKVNHHVSIARSQNIHTGNVGGDPRWYVDLATKRDVLRRYARGRNKPKLLKNPRTRGRSICLWQRAN